MALASKLVMIALMAPGLMIADLCTSSDICTYGINATGLDTSMAPLTEDARNTWDLTFQFAGRDLYNDGPNTLLSFRVTGSPAAGWVYDNAQSGLSSYGSDGDAIVTFDDTNSATDGFGVASATYTFYATDSFWATAGSNIAFGATSDSSANSGSFFTLTTDPPCAACRATITANPAAAVEPTSGVLLGAVGGIALNQFRKRKNHDA